MSQNNDSFSTIKISPELISRIVDSLKNKAYGSIEIFIQDHSVTQITERTINKFTGRSSKKNTLAKKGKKESFTDPVTT